MYQKIIGMYNTESCIYLEIESSCAHKGLRCVDSFEVKHTTLSYLIKLEKEAARWLKVMINQQCRSANIINLKCNKPKSSQREKIKNLFPQGVR